MDVTSELGAISEMAGVGYKMTSVVNITVSKTNDSSIE